MFSIILNISAKLVGSSTALTTLVGVNNFMKLVHTICILNMVSVGWLGAIIPFLTYLPSVPLFCTYPVPLFHYVGHENIC